MNTRHIKGLSRLPERSLPNPFNRGMLSGSYRTHAAGTTYSYRAWCEASARRKLHWIQWLLEPHSGADSAENAPARGICTRCRLAQHFRSPAHSTPLGRSWRFSAKAPTICSSLQQISQAHCILGAELSIARLMQCRTAPSSQSRPARSL